MKHYLSYLPVLALGLAAAAAIGCGETARHASSQPGVPMEAASNPTPLDRKIVRTGSLTVRVSDVQASEQKVRSLVMGHGGYVESVTTGDREARVPRVNFTVRVPVSKFDQAMAELSALGKRIASLETSEDVTLEAVDLGARLRTMQAEEVSLQEMMKLARSVDASIRIHERLSKIRGQIESMEGQRKALEHQAAMSTISVELQGDPVASAAGNSDWSKDAWAGARAKSTELLQGVGTVGIFALVLWPLWAVPLAFIGLGVWQSRRRAASARAE